MSIAECYDPKHQRPSGRNSSIESRGIYPLRQQSIDQRPLVRINRYQPDIGVWRLEEIGLEICERYPLAVTQLKTLPKCVGEVNPRADEVNG
jgi:hypothetical protein